MKTKKWFIIVAVGLVVLLGAYFLYIDTAFTGTKCEGADVKHGEVPQELHQCYNCHVETTPKIAQDWHESKHGYNLVKCYVCHGQPDGEGAIAFTAEPDVDQICIRCHGPAMERMEQKFGDRTDCSTCHPYHGNSLHHEAYEKTVSKKTLDEE